MRYDKTGDQHYDTISAFIKSMRGSDPDAAVFYLAKMLYAGEDIKFIARRIMICAAEDVGLADPNALNVAVSASLAVERVGMPEAQIILAEAATYVACAPKSNSSCEAVFAAMKTVGSVRTSVPPHLQDAHYKGSAKLGHGQGYQYAHDYPNHYVEQQYLPDEILGSRFLHLGTNGYEQKIRENFKKLEKTSNKGEEIMTDWLGKPYYSLDAYLKKTFGEKVYKLSLDGGMTCPNRDGTCGDRGCIFCSAGGSGDLPGTETNPSRNRSGSRNFSCSKSDRCISSSPISRRIRTRTRRWNIWKNFPGGNFGRGGRGPFDRNETGLLRGRDSFSVRRAEPDQTGLGGAGTADDA